MADDSKATQFTTSSSCYAKTDFLSVVTVNGMRPARLPQSSTPDRFAWYH
jgi:hypothetical protein